MIEVVKNKEAEAKVTAFLKSKDLPANAGFGSQAIVVGLEGTITSIGLVVVKGPGIKPRTAAQGPQVIDGVTVAKVNEHSVTLSLIFDKGKRSVATNTLTQHPESAITVDGNELQFADMVGQDWAKLIGARVKCDDVARDLSRMIPRQKRNAEPGEMEDRPTQKYHFVVTAAAKAQTPPAETPEEE